MKKILCAAVFLSIVLLLTPLSPAHDSPLHTGMMPYDFWSEPLEDDIYHIATGVKLSFEAMMDMTSASRIIYIGEAHTNIHAHRVQLEVIRDLQSRFPGQIAIGMEMFRVPQQDSLDRWTRGELDETEFLKESGWYNNWHSNFGYYRDILNYARENSIDVVALNPSRVLQHSMAMKDAENLPAEVTDQLPEMDSSDIYQREMMKAIFSGHSGGQNMFRPFMRIQLLWEETMASRIADYLTGEAGTGKKMVVLAGGMHVEYGFGVPKKVLRRLPQPYSIILSSAISIPEEKKDEVLMDVDIPAIPLLAGDFLWMVNYEDLEEKQIQLGIRMRMQEKVIIVDGVLEDSAAEAAGIQEGDELVSLDWMAVSEMMDVVLSIKAKKEGDTVTIIVRRDGELLTFTPEL